MMKCRAYSMRTSIRVISYRFLSKAYFQLSDSSCTETQHRNKMARVVRSRGLHNKQTLSRQRRMPLEVGLDIGTSMPIILEKMVLGARLIIVGQDIEICSVNRRIDCWTLSCRFVLSTAYCPVLTF